MIIFSRIVVTLALFLLAFPVYAETPLDTKAETTKILTYLNTLKTAQARFVQTAHDGTQFVGTFYLERPGKLRFEYDEPVEDFIVADGTFIYYYDAELGEQSNAPIGQTLADFFLRKDISFDGDINVQSVRRAPNMLLITLAQAEDPAAGSITFGFRENEGENKDELSLKKWRVVDPQGLITEVELFYLRDGITHPGGLFAYIDPNHGKASYNQ